MTGTETMLADKAGAIGRMTFNNPARHNAVSVAMWQAAVRILEDFLGDPAIRVIVHHRGRRESFCLGRRIFPSLRKPDPRARRSMSTRR